MYLFGRFQQPAVSLYMNSLMAKIAFSILLKFVLGFKLILLSFVPGFATYRQVSLHIAA